MIMWKKATVTAIHKKGYITTQTTDTLNSFYRPVIMSLGPIYVIDL